MSGNGRSIREGFIEWVALDQSGKIRSLLFPKRGWKGIPGSG